MPEEISEALFQLFPETAFLRQNGLGVADASQRNEDSKKAESVEKEISRHAEERHGKAAQRRAKNARHIELRGVECDRVGKVFSRHKLRHQSLVRGRIERHGDAGSERDKNDLMHVNDLEICQRGH